VGGGLCTWSAKKRYPTTLAQSEEMTRSKNKEHAKSALRIIAGQWRSRKLDFTPARGLRPTPDRVRETLFNWLTPMISGASCADLFAGSGALGLEALSRGAQHCDFVDTSSATLAQILQHLNTLGARAMGSCYAGSAQQYLEATNKSLDIVFIDPPFGCELAEEACQLLSGTAVLAANAWVYLETARAEGLPQLPPGWHLHRDKTAGDVSYRLFNVG
jgi:16S rRNA (guanine966-N2)-methyltransferase